MGQNSETRARSFTRGRFATRGPSPFSDRSLTQSSADAGASSSLVDEEARAVLLPVLSAAVVVVQFDEPADHLERLLRADEPHSAYTSSKPV